MYFRKIPGRYRGGRAIWSDPTPAGSLVRNEFWGQAQTAIIGTAAGTFDVTGAATGTVSSAGITGQAAGTFEVTGGATGRVAVSGIASGLVGLSGSASAVALIAGQAGGTFTVTGAATGTVAVTAQAAGAFEVTGTATGEVEAVAPPAPTTGGYAGYVVVPKRKKAKKPKREEPERTEPPETAAAFIAARVPPVDLSDVKQGLSDLRQAVEAAHDEWLARQEEEALIMLLMVM